MEALLVRGFEDGGMELITGQYRPNERRDSESRRLANGLRRRDWGVA
jgi:hypothetical protein